MVGGNAYSLWRSACRFDVLLDEGAVGGGVLENERSSSCYMHDCLCCLCFLYGLACLPVVCLLVGAGRVVLGDGGVMSVRTRGVAHDTTIFDSLIPNPLVSPTLFGPPPPKHEDVVERNHFLIFFSSIRAIS